jgi:hypothetical protein
LPAVRSHHFICGAAFRTARSSRHHQCRTRRRGVFDARVFIGRFMRLRPSPERQTTQGVLFGPLAARPSYTRLSSSSRSRACGGSTSTRVVNACARIGHSSACRSGCGRAPASASDQWPFHCSLARGRYFEDQ